MTNEPGQQKKKAQQYDLEVGTAVVAGAFIVVLLLHILGVWGLISGMGKGDSPPPPPKPPIQTRVLPPPPPPASYTPLPLPTSYPVSLSVSALPLHQTT